MLVRRWALAAVGCLAFAAAPGLARAGVPSWTTYHHDAARSGIDPDSTSPVTPTMVWQSDALDGEVWAQPLVYGSRVYVATENDTVYALDAATGAIVWHTHLATPVDASQLCNGDIDPTVGITSTPVIDPTTGRIYVVADTEEKDDASTIAHEMYALSLSDGTVAVGPVAVDPPGVSASAPSGDTPANQLQRASLALDDGKVIIGYGGNDGDCNTYHGWLVATPESGTGTLQAFEVDSQPGDDQGAIWGSGNAPAIDSSGDIWIATGNGTSSDFDYSESVIKLDPNLGVLDFWAPTDWQDLDGSDLDLGSTMPLLLPDGLVFEIGKQGVGFLLSASSLGDAVGKPLYSATVCTGGGGDWGGGIYYNGAIYVTCLYGSNDGMHALKLNTTAKTFAALSTWTVDSNAVGPPIEAAGLIWSADWNNGTNALYGLDPSTGAETFVSGNLNGFEHFTTPSAAGGQLFVANQTSGSGDQVTAFQIASAPPASPTTLTLSSSTNPVPEGQTVTFTATVSPTPDAGNVSFTDGGAPIAGCGAVAISAMTPQATCTTTLSGAGTHSILASYSGDPYYSASGASVGEVVTSPAPVVTPPGPTATPTATRITSSADPSQAGAPVTFVASVSPSPDGGTIAFTDDGAPIPTCSTTLASPTDLASCTVSFRVAGKLTIAAAYSGDPDFLASSASLTQTVLATPVITHLGARVARRRLRLSLTISAAARLGVAVYRRVSGRLVHGRCRVGAMRGRLCRVLRRRAAFSLSAAEGRNTFEIRPPAPGRYVIAVSVVVPAGGRSRRYAASFTVPAPR